MLVKFHTKAFPKITMFGDIAIRLIELMGHSGTVPSALSPEDVPKALMRLKVAIADDAARAPEDSDDEPDADEESTEEAVSLAHRAMPLIELLEAAARENTGVMWDT